MDDVTALVAMFEESEESTRDNRKLCERDDDYYHNKQWTDDEITALGKRKQPVVTYNRIQRKVDFLSGLEKQQRKDPKAFPRTPQDQDSADAATDAIRYVCDNSKWDNQRSAAWDDLLIKGTGVVFVGHKKARGNLRATTSLTPPIVYDPNITHVAWDRFFYDPKSSRADFSDARFMGIVTWYDLSDAERKWKDAKDALTSTLSNDRDGDTYDDKPKEKMWGDAKRRRVRVVELYHKEADQWTRCVFTWGGYLEPKAPSPYLDEDGEPENPIKAISLYVDRNNNRYGLVRVMISPQDMVNKAHSKAMHLNAMRQVRVSPVASQDPEKIRAELAKPDGVVMGEKDDFEILPTNDMAAGQFNLLQLSMNEIDLLGANAALAGKNENDMSGRAILAQQQGGMVEVARAFDRLRTLSLDVYTSVWNRVRQLWTAERWLRITGTDRNVKFVGLNWQVTVKEIAEEVAKGDPAGLKSAEKLVGPQLLQAYMQGDQQAQMVLGQFVQANGDQVAEVRNAVGELNVDIEIDEGMDTPAVQAEQFELLAKILPQIINLPTPYAIALVTASALRDKDKIIELLEQMQQQDPMAEQMQQIQVEGAVAEVDKTKSETVLNQAKAQQADPSAQMQIEGMKAEHSMALAERGQEHKMQMDEQRNHQGMVQAERKQAFGEHMAQRQAEQRPEAA